MADDISVLALQVESSQAVRSLRNFAQETTGVTSAVKQATVALASLFASAKVTQFITRTSAEFANFGDQMAKMSQRLDISAQTLTEMSYVASQAGTSIEQLEAGMRYLQRNLYNADEEAKAASGAFKKLGVSISEIKTLSPDEQFKKVASAIAGLQSPAERTAMTMQIFGRGGTALIPLFNQGTNGIDKLSKKARELGIVLEEGDYPAAEALNDSMDTLTKSIGAVRNAIIAGLTPDLVTAAESIAQTAGEIVKFVREHELLVKTVLKLGVAIASITAVYGAYKILQTAMMAQRALRATLAAQQAQNIAQTTAETAALTANTTAQIANNAAKGAGVATGGGKAAAGMLGGTGAAAFAFTAIAAGAVSNFIDGFKKASKEGARTFSSSVKGTLNAVTFGLATIGDKWKDAGQGPDAGIERTKALANTFTLGISGVTEKLAQQLGITATIRDVLLAMNEDYQAEVQRGQEYDVRLKTLNEQREVINTGKGYAAEGYQDLRESDEWKDFEQDQANRRKKLTLNEMEGAQFDVDVAQTKMDEAQQKYQNWNKDSAAATETAKNAYSEMVAKLDEYKKLQDEIAGDPRAYQRGGELDAMKAEAVEAVKAYQDAKKTADSFTDSNYKELAESVTKTQEEYMAARQNLASITNEDESRKREERIAQEDSALQSRYTGSQSDEAAAEKAKQEAALLSGRLSEMETAAARAEEIKKELAGTTDLQQVAQLRQELELQENIAGSLQDRLSISDEINQKNTEHEQTLSRIAEREEELTRIREERNKQMAEQAQKLTEDYAVKNMNNFEKVGLNQAKMLQSFEEAETLARREQYIKDMDEQIKALGVVASQGGAEGVKAEETMNKLVQERAREEERLQQDKSKNLDKQFAALNAIDDIAGAKAEEYTNKWKEQMEKWNEAEKSDRKPVSAQRAVDAASAEGFAQMTKIYDTSQKKIEDHTKNIKQYTREMKAYLMQLVAQGKTSWALDVEGA